MITTPMLQAAAVVAAVAIASWPAVAAAVQRLADAAKARDDVAWEAAKAEFRALMEKRK